MDSPQSADDEGPRHRFFCNLCNSPTRHRLLYNYDHKDALYDDDGTVLFDYPESWTILQCQGCESLLLRAITDPPWEKDGPITSFYPAQERGKHRHKIYLRLPVNLKNLYREVVSVFNEGQYLLCAAGLRALVEGICAEKEIKEGPNAKGIIVQSLEGKINSLKDIVPIGIVRNLHGFRFLGNKALHRLAEPSKDDLKLALRVIEDLLNVVYDLDYRAQQLYEQTTRED